VEASNGFGIVLLFVADSMYLACPDKVENCSRCCPIHEQVKKPLKNKFPSVQKVIPENKGQGPLSISRLVCTMSACGVMRKKLHHVSCIEWQVFKSTHPCQTPQFHLIRKTTFEYRVIPTPFSHHTSSHSRKGYFRINHISYIWTQELESN